MWRSMCTTSCPSREHGVVRFDHVGGDLGDPGLLRRVRHDVVFVARLVRQSLPQHGAAVRAREYAFSLEEHESRRIVISETPRSSLSVVTRMARRALSAATIRARLSAGSISRTSDPDNELLPKPFATLHRSRPDRVVQVDQILWRFSSCQGPCEAAILVLQGAFPDSVNQRKCSACFRGTKLKFQPFASY